jgi:Mn-dependent DtxR family transcriptional regulator
MGQIDILNYLRKTDGWHSTKAIAHKLDVSPSVVALSLRKLHKWGLVELSLRPKNKYLYKSSKGLNTSKPTWEK